MTTLSVVNVTSAIHPDYGTIWLVWVDEWLVAAIGQEGPLPVIPDKSGNVYLEAATLARGESKFIKLP